MGLFILGFVSGIAFLSWLRWESRMAGPVPAVSENTASGEEEVAERQDVVLPSLPLPDGPQPIYPEIDLSKVGNGCCWGCDDDDYVAHPGVRLWTQEDEEQWQRGQGASLE